MSEPPPATAEWTERYRRYVERSMLRSGRAEELNREVLRRLTTGELAAWTLDSQLTFFMATHAAAYSQRITRLTSDFLAGMIQVGSTYSHELIERILPGATDEPDTASVPRLDPAVASDWLTDLVRFAGEENARALSQLRLVMDRVASGQLMPAEVQEISARFQSERVWGSTTRLVELFFDLLTGLEEVHSSFNEEYLNMVLGMGRPAPPGPEAAVRADAVRVEAPLGGPATIRFAVANTEAEPIAVRCQLSGVRRADGVGPAFDPSVTTEPEYLELAPGAEAAVVLTVHTDPDHFQPGTRYESVLRVADDSRRLLELPLNLDIIAAHPSLAERAGATEAQ